MSKGGDEQFVLTGIPFPVTDKAETKKKKVASNLLSPHLEYKKTDLVSLMRYDFTLAEIKAVTVLMIIAAEQLKEDPERRKFTAMVKDVSVGTRLKYRSDKLRELIYGLQHKPVILNVIEKHGGPRVAMGSLVSWAEFEEGRNASFDFFFPDRLRDQLRDPDYFTLIKMIAMQSITSKHTYAIYEFCKSYYKLGQTKSLTVDELVFFLGMDEGSYKNFADLEKRVLLVAKQEMANSENIEIEIDYVAEKRNRKVHSIYFKVTEKKAKLALIEQNTVVSRLLVIIPEYNQTEKTRDMLRTWSSRKGEEYCIGNIEYAFTTCKKERSFSIYLQKALVDNWGVENLEKRKSMREMASLSGKPLNSSNYFNPELDLEYQEKFQALEDKKQKAIRFELERRIMSGSIKKFLPKLMQVRLAMQFLEAE